MSVIFLRSPVAAVPCAERRWSSRRALSLSVSESSADALLTPADFSCSSSAAGGRLSSAASWATVVEAIWCLSLGGRLLRRGGAGRLRGGLGRIFLRRGLGCKPVLARFHGLGGLGVDARDLLELVDGEVGQVVPAVHAAGLELGNQLGRQAFEIPQV